MRHFAQRLIAYEQNANKPAGEETPAAFTALEKLRGHLVTFMGFAGFRELLSCVLPRATAEIPWLGTVQVKADGTLEGLDGLGTKHSPEELAEGGVVLIAQLLGLLEAFVGETLTMGFVREVWPYLPLDGLAFGKGFKNEKTE